MSLGTNPCPNDPAESRDPFNVTARHILRALLYAGGIAFLCLALILSMGRARLSQSGIELMVSLFYSVSIALPSMFLLNWIGPRFNERFPRMVFLFYAMALVCTGTTGTLATGLLLEVTGIIPRGQYWRAFWMNYPFALVITLVAGLSITFFETLRFKLQAATLELRTKQVEQERAYKLLAEARLSSLESRLHPHFLFNTLNSIAALIPSDPKRAEDTVGKLASLLRFSLNAHQRGLVPLSQEIKVVRDYLEIEQTRFGARLRYEIALPQELGGVKVPPLALQSLVENTVKHVVSKTTAETTIQIAGRRESDGIHLEVRDDGPGFALDAITPEHGLGNLIARIDLLFGSAGRLEVARVEGQTAVRLVIPAE